MHHYLVIANHTLGGPELLEAIRDRMSRGPAQFRVLAPATPTTHLLNDFNALSCAFPVDPDVLPSAADDRTRELAVEAAQARVEAEVRRLRDIGADVDGAVGDADPMRALDAALRDATVRDAPYDEILLATLPPGLSRWLAWDLPHRLRRHTNVPLTVITTERSSRSVKGQ